MCITAHCLEESITNISLQTVIKMKIILTHWGRVMHICVSKLAIIGSENGLSPGRLQAIIWTNAGISLIGPLGTNFNEISIEIRKISFKKIHFKISSGKWRPSCLGLNVLITKLHAYYLVCIRGYTIAKINLAHWMDLNSLAPARCGNYFRRVISEHLSWIKCLLTGEYHRTW